MALKWNLCEWPFFCVRQKPIRLLPFRLLEQATFNFLSIWWTTLFKHLYKIIELYNNNSIELSTLINCVNNHKKQTKFYFFKSFCIELNCSWSFSLVLLRSYILSYSIIIVILVMQFYKISITWLLHQVY